MSRAATRSRATKETSIDIAIDLDGIGYHRRVDRHPVLRPHARPARPPRRVRSHVRGGRRPPHRHPPHGRRRRDHARRGVPRGARRQGRRATVRERPVPARRGAGRRRARPVRAARSWCGRSSCPSACRSATGVRPAARRARGARRSPPRPGSRCTSSSSAAATSTTSSRPRSRASPVPARRGARRRSGRRPVDEGRPVSRRRPLPNPTVPNCLLQTAPRAV